jgi:hypothetical protein
MRWDVTTPPATTPIGYPDCKAHLRIDSDAEMPWFVNFGIPAAVDYCETYCQRSLITRQMTATYTIEDQPHPHVRHHRHHGLYCYPSAFLGPLVDLPRGPVQSVQSAVTAAGVTVDPSQYALRRIGTSDYLQLPTGAWPVTVTYTAGFGTAAASVPAKLRMAMLMHVASLWDTRSATTDRPMNHVLHGLQAMYGQSVSEVTL